MAKTGEEDALFDNMFEIVLKEDYEKNYNFRDEERVHKDMELRQEYHE